ncbi:MAG: response regulator [bacterium]
MANILIVDDEDDIRYVLSLLLKSEGFGVLEASDGKTAFEILKTNAVDLILLDIVLPDINGVQVLKEIKKQYKTPVIMISGYGNIQAAIESMKIGAVDYVPKPFDNEKLLDLIAKTLEKQSFGKEKGLLKSRLLQSFFGKEKVDKEEIELPKRKNYSFHILYFLLFIILAYFGIGIIKNILSNSFNLAYNHPSGLAYKNGKFYISDWYSRNIYVHKLFPNFKIRNIFYLKEEVPFGITIENDYIWICDNWTKKVYRYKLVNMKKITEYDLPNINPSGITYDGKYLWISDINSRTITKHNIDESLSIEKKFHFDNLSPIALFWKDNTIWSADEKSGIINKHRIDGTLSIEKSFIPIQLASGELKMLSAGTDGKSIYILTVSENKGIILRQNHKTLIPTNENK